MLIVKDNAELQILPLGSSGKILTPFGFLTKACHLIGSNKEHSVDRALGMPLAKEILQTWAFC